MIKDTVKENLKDAMRAKDQLRVDTLRGILAAFTNELVAKGKKPTEELTEQEQLTVIKRLAKQRKDAAEQFEKGGRADLAEKEQAELKILEVYIPAGASREEIAKVAKAKKEELGITDKSGIGKLMGAVIKEFAGAAESAVVKEVVEALFEDGIEALLA